MGTIGKLYLLGPMDLLRCPHYINVMEDKDEANKVGTELQGHQNFFTGDTLESAYEKTYGFTWNTMPQTIYEAIELDRHKDILDLINQQKVYHITGLVRQFFEQGITKYKVERVQNILIRRGLLKPIPIKGAARATRGIILICTPDCSQADIDGYLIEFNVHDELRYAKELQRGGSVSIDKQKEAWKAQSLGAKEVKEEIAADELDEITCEHGLRKNMCYEGKCGIRNRRRGGPSL